MWGADKRSVWGGPPGPRGTPSSRLFASLVLYPSTKPPYKSPLKPFCYLRQCLTLRYTDLTQKVTHSASF